MSILSDPFPSLLALRQRVKTQPPEPLRPAWEGCTDQLSPAPADPVVFGPPPGSRTGNWWPTCWCPCGSGQGDGTACWQCGGTG